MDNGQACDTPIATLLLTLLKFATKFGVVTLDAKAGCK
jgi:hypothetical protein